MKVVVFDIDGTLSNVEKRKHHLEKSPKDFDSFYLAMGEDDPRVEIIDLCNMHFDAGWTVFLFTGRPESYRELTVTWLEKHKVSYHELHMRPDAQRYESDYKIKQEMIEKVGVKISLAIDDRDQAVRMWRENGIVCLQCAEGKF